MAIRSTADCRCGLVVRPVRCPNAVSRGVDHPSDRRLAVRACDVDARIAQLRAAQQLHQRRDPCRADGSSLVSGQRWSSRCSTCSRCGDLVRRGFGKVIQIGQPCGDPLDLPLPAVWRPGSSHDVGGSLGQERRVVEFGRGACQFLLRRARSFSSRRRPAATSTVPEVSSSMLTVPRTAGPPPARWRRSRRPDWSARPAPSPREPMVGQAAGSTPVSRAGTFAGRPGPGRCGKRRISVTSFLQIGDRCAAA